MNENLENKTPEHHPLSEFEASILIKALNEQRQTTEVTHATLAKLLNSMMADHTDMYVNFNYIDKKWKDAWVNGSYHNQVQELRRKVTQLNKVFRQFNISFGGFYNEFAAFVDTLGKSDEKDLDDLRNSSDNINREIEKLVNSILTAYPISPMEAETLYEIKKSKYKINISHPSPEIENWVKLPEELNIGKINDFMKTFAKENDFNLVFAGAPNSFDPFVEHNTSSYKDDLRMSKYRVRKAGAGRMSRGGVSPENYVPLYTEMSSTYTRIVPPLKHTKKSELIHKAMQKSIKKIRANRPFWITDDGVRIPVKNLGTEYIMTFKDKMKLISDKYKQQIAHLTSNPTDFTIFTYSILPGQEYRIDLTDLFTNNIIEEHNTIIIAEINDLDKKNVLSFFDDLRSSKHKYIIYSSLDNDIIQSSDMKKIYTHSLSNTKTIPKYYEYFLPCIMVYTQLSQYAQYSNSTEEMKSNRIKSIIIRLMGFNSNFYTLNKKLIDRDVNTVLSMLRLSNLITRNSLNENGLKIIKNYIKDPIKNKIELKHLNRRTVFEIDDLNIKTKTKSGSNEIHKYISNKYLDQLTKFKKYLNDDEVKYPGKAKYASINESFKLYQQLSRLERVREAFND